MVHVHECPLVPVPGFLRKSNNGPLCNFVHGLFLWVTTFHDDVIKWKHFPRYWPFVRGIHRSPVNSTHKGQWRGALMFSLICIWINGWVNNREAGDLRRYRAHYDVIVMFFFIFRSRSIRLIVQIGVWWDRSTPLATGEEYFLFWLKLHILRDLHIFICFMKR